jgi:hypothetical protein
MIRAALPCLLLSGCSHVLIVPVVDRSFNVRCCQALIEVSPATHISASMDDAGHIKAGLNWKF